MMLPSQTVWDVWELKFNLMLDLVLSSSLYVLLLRRNDV